MQIFTLRQPLHFSADTALSSAFNIFSSCYVPTVALTIKFPFRSVGRVLTVPCNGISTGVEMEFTVPYYKFEPINCPTFVNYVRMVYYHSKYFLTAFISITVM